MSGFTIVEFSLEDVTDFVPLTWVKGDSCYWPADVGKLLSPSQTRLRDNPLSEPNKKWRQVPILIKYISTGKDTHGIYCIVQ